MKTIFLQPGGGLDIDENGLFLIDPDDADSSENRHRHFVFPAPVCPDIESILISFDEPCTVSFEPNSVLLPRLSSIGGRWEGGDVWERLFEVIDAPVLTEIEIGGFDDMPTSVFQKTSLKKIDLDSARVPVSIPDDIRNLVNLESFKLWRAKVSYMSPELFRLPCIREISFYSLGYEPTPEVIAAAEAFEAAGGLFRSADEVGDIFPHRSKQRAVPEVSPEILPPDPGQDGQQKTEVATVFVLPNKEESSECLQGPKERPFIVVEGESGKSYCCIDRAGTYVFPDKPNPEITWLTISSKDSSDSFDPKILSLPNLRVVCIPFKFPTSPEFWKAVAEFGARGGCLAQELAPDKIEGECLRETKPLFKIVAADKNRRFGHLACGIPLSALAIKVSVPRFVACLNSAMPS